MTEKPHDLPLGPIKLYPAKIVWVKRDKSSPKVFPKWAVGACFVLEPEE